MPACLLPSGEESLVKEDPARLPLDALPYSLAEIWQVIRSQKDLNLPAHKVWGGHASGQHNASKQFCVPQLAAC
jgi:hypothetical protein